VSIQRVLFVGLSLLCLGLATERRLSPGPELVVIDPLAPPLTRIASLGDRTLGPEPRPPPQLRQAPPPSRPADSRGHTLRLAVEADALAIAEVLGPERVGWALAQREELSASLAETATWNALVEELERPQPPEGGVEGTPTGGGPVGGPG